MKKLLLYFLLFVGLQSLATNYYFSSSTGNDSNNGTISSPYATLSKVRSLTTSPGDSILFKRGDTFRGYITPNNSGSGAGNIIYSAYGVGNKPIISGAFDATLSSNWTNYSANIWYCTVAGNWGDASNLYFNNDASFGFKKMSLVELINQGYFYFESSTGRVYLYSTSIPSSFYTHIEIAGVWSKDIFSITSKSYITIRDLHFKYAAGSGYQSESASNISILNNEFSWCGGTWFVGGPSRLGNGISLWLSNNNIVIANNYIHDIYDAGITPQGTVAGTNVNNVDIHHNLIVNCEYSYEFFERDATTSVTNVFFDNNTCVNAGAGSWSHNQRPSKNGCHIRLYSFTAAKSNLTIRNNIFYSSSDEIIYFYTVSDINNFTFDYNCYYTATGNFCYLSGVPITYTFAQFKTATSNDAHSISSDPLFVNAPYDFQLQSGSPARNTGTSLGLLSDIIGTSIPQEGITDIGAYEYYIPNPWVLGTVTLDNPINVTSRSILLKATAALDGGGTISERGICYSTSANPTTGDSKIVNGSGLGSFTTTITKLNPHTTYHFRSYCINEAGTAYSNDVIIITAYSSTINYNDKTLSYIGKSFKY